MNTPGNDANAILQQALALHQSGRIDQAAEIYRKLLRQFPTHPQLLYLLGTAELQRQNLPQSVQLLEKSLAQQSEQPGAWGNLGNALLRLGRYQEALTACRRAVTLDPRFAEAHNTLGGVLRKLNRFDEALAAFGRALQLNPRYTEAHTNRGSVLLLLLRNDEALAEFDAALQLNPRHAEAHNNRGSVLALTGRDEEALAACDQAIALKPDYAGAHSNRGNALKNLQRFDEALAAYGKAIALDPDLADAHNNRGSILRERNRPEDAVASFDRAIELRPNDAYAHYGRGNALKDLMRLDEAMASLDRATALNPDLADAYWSKSLIKLLTGDLAEGWRLYERRWDGSTMKQAPRTFAQPLWLGETPLAGKTLLIHAEQGLGDTVQFCRYAPLAAAQGAHVVLEVQATLKPLIATLQGDIEVVAAGEPLPTFDYHCPMLSLPLAFQTVLETIPGKTPYLFTDPARREVWRTRLGEKKTKRIGLVWGGKYLFGSDFVRNMPARHIAPLLTLPFEFHCLQKQIWRDDQAAVQAMPQIHTHMDELNDFADTAALIAEMDLIVTSDTSIAHVSGALGMPMWLLTCWGADWRWLMERRDCPWYPSATLFRQPEKGDWESVVGKIREKLQTL
jgi:tetratricopeptide (TPR) repeat protein